MAYVKMTADEKCTKMFGSNIDLLEKSFYEGKSRALNGYKLFSFDCRLDMRNLAKSLRCDISKIDQSVYEQYIRGYTLGLSIAYDSAVADLEELVK